MYAWVNFIINEANADTISMIKDYTVLKSLLNSS